MKYSMVKKTKQVLKWAVTTTIRLLQRKPFVGAWATFEYLDDTCNATLGLRRQGYQNIVTHSPCARHELRKALDTPESKIPLITFLFAILGLITAVTMTVWMSLDWVLPVSGKPIVSAYPVMIITFELIILFAVMGTVLGMLGLVFYHRFRVKLPGSKIYKKYKRFTQDRFGIVVSCDQASIQPAIDLFEKFSAEEIHREA